LAAFCLYVGKRARIEFFVTLDPVIFQTIIVAGIIGACSVVVEACRGAWLVFETMLPVYRERRILKRTALKNMEVLTREYAAVLRFLKTNNTKRFPARQDSRVLSMMREACLLELDDPNWSIYSLTTYYVVPDHVWGVIDQHLKDFPVSASPPWLPPPPPQEWTIR
jgi:hypothetical protein